MDNDKCYIPNELFNREILVMPEEPGVKPVEEIAKDLLSIYHEFHFHDSGVDIIGRIMRKCIRFPEILPHQSMEKLYHVERHLVEIEDDIFNERKTLLQSMLEYFDEEILLGYGY